MESIVIAFFAAESMWQENSQDPSIVEVVFLGMESETFKFSDKDGFIFEFKTLVGEAYKKYDLSDSNLINENFYVTYRTQIEIDESKEGSLEYEVYIITDLELIDD